MIRNPILPGFHPDPSILRVEDDYYIATSTFEWFPGVQIHHSRDLVHWRLLGYALTRTSQLNMSGNPNSGGVWAPCLSYSDSTFYLIYTDVKTQYGAFRDCHNFLVTAQAPDGPWSDPIYLNSSGFDPSLFHDSDGRKWLLNVRWDHRKNNHPFAGILLQEYSTAERRLTGPVQTIFRGTLLGCTEAPHLYKRRDAYYLMTAEGGTFYEHAVTVARSDSLFGPYEVDPQNPILTSDNNFELPLQRAGHASLVETQTGDWYLAHLCGRPLKPRKLCTLGRETGLQKAYWTDVGWLRLEGNTNEPKVEVPAPALPPFPFEQEPDRDDFDAPELNKHFNTLRLPADESWLSLAERPGYLRLRGRESLQSKHRQSLVARRQTSFYCEAETCVEFEPEHFQHLAGLICFYDTQDYLYLNLTYSEELGKCLTIIRSDRGNYDEPLSRPVSLESWKRCYLKVLIRRERLRFFYSNDGENWRRVGLDFDVGHLADEYGPEDRFTGTFIGVCVQDLSGMSKHADFDFFTYRESLSL